MLQQHYARAPSWHAGVRFGGCQEAPQVGLDKRRPTTLEPGGVAVSIPSQSTTAAVRYIQLLTRAGAVFLFF